MGSKKSDRRKREKGWVEYNACYPPSGSNKNQLKTVASYYFYGQVLPSFHGLEGPGPPASGSQVEPHLLPHSPPNYSPLPPHWCVCSSLKELL